MKTTTFFCENCGSTVPAEDDECPNCKLRFTGVRCPRCSHQDSVSAFLKGCPKCGYKIGSESSTSSKKTKERASAPPRNTSLDFFMLMVILLLATFTMLLYFSGSP